MKKEISIHFTFWILLFVLITLFKRWFSVSFWPFWVGGIMGTILPDVDHLIYAYFLRPQELVSQRVNYLTQERNFRKVFELLAETRYERSKIIFHTVYFQIIFLVLTFFVVTSSGSLFGTGLVLAFCIHLLVDQLVDFLNIGNLNTWFQATSITLTKEQTVFYWLGMFLIVLILGIIV